MFSSYEVVFNDHVIDISNCEKHLGSYIGRNSNYTIVMNYIRESNAMLNYLCSIFSDTDFNVRYKMFKIYCLSMFNVVLWDLGSSEMSTFYCNWRKSIRKLLNLPLLCHSDFLHRIVNDIPIDAQIKKRCANFYCSIFNSRNVIVNLCSKLVNEGSGSVVSNNFNVLCEEFTLNRHCDLSWCKNILTKINYIDQSDVQSEINIIISLIQDVLHMQTNSNFLDCNEIKDMLYFLCNS